jgi:hypothetical protein
MKRAGIPRVGPTGEKRTFHSFRHTYAKRALENGRRITWLSRHLGHSSLKVTTDVYGHWEAGERRKEAQLMQGLFGVWQVIRSKTVYGDVAATGVNATVRKPKGIAVHFQGSGEAAWGCSKGFSVSSWSRQFTGGGFHVLPYVRGKDSCDVVASVSGQHVARVWIYKARW